MQPPKIGNLVHDSLTFDIYLVIEVFPDGSVCGLEWEKQTKTEIIHPDDIIEVIELPPNVKPTFFMRAQKVLDKCYKDELW